MDDPTRPTESTADTANLARLEAAAVELECDNDPEAFDAVMRKVLKAPPQRRAARKG